MISNIAIALTLILPCFYFLLSRNLVLSIIYIVLYVIAFYLASNKLTKVIFKRLTKNYKLSLKTINLTYIYLWLLSNIPVVIYNHKYSVLVFLLVAGLFLVNYVYKKIVAKFTIRYTKRNKTITNYLTESYLGKDTIINKDLQDIRSHMFNKYLLRYQQSLLRNFFLNYVIYGLNAIYVLICLWVFKDYKVKEIFIILYLTIYAALFLSKIFYLKRYLKDIRKLRKDTGEMVDSFKEIIFNDTTISDLLVNFTLDIKKNDKIYILKEDKNYQDLLEVFINERHYDGSILIDNKQLKYLDLTKVLTFEEFNPWFKKSTIIDNVLYNKSVPSSKLHDYFKKYLPSNYFNSLDNDEGTYIENLDGYPIYYKKLLAILRSIISDKNIILLDDPFIELSKYNQNIIEKELSKLHKTIIILSSVAPTIKTYDKVILLENGIIKEAGTYDELMKQKRDFYRFINNR